MSLHYLSNTQIQRERWDKLVLSSPRGSIYGLSWYLDAAFPDWKGLIWDDYEAVYTVPAKRKWGIIPYAYNPFFIRHCGIYGNTVSPEFEKQIVRFFHRNFLRSRLNMFEPHQLPTHGNIQPRKFQLLDLHSTFQYDSNTKRNLKKAEQSGLQLMGIAPFTVVDIFRRNKGGDLGQFHENDYNRLEATMKACVAQNAGEGYAAVSAAGEIMAAGFFSFVRDTITYLNGATTEAGKKNGGMHFLMDAVIQLYHHSYRYLDMGGSNVEGVARFYRSFGASDMTYSLWMNR